MKNLAAKALDIAVGAAVILAVFAAAKFALGLAGARFPAPIAGMLLLFALMCLKLVPMRQTEAACRLILDNMAIFFIPILVSLFLGDKLPRDKIFSIVLILALSTVATLAVTALSVEFIQKKSRARGSSENVKAEADK